MSLKISKRHIVTLWHETQVGNIHTCREKQLEFSDMMWKLYENMQPEVFNVKKSLKDLTTLTCKHGNDYNALCADCDDETYHETQDDKAKEKV